MKLKVKTEKKKLPRGKLTEIRSKPGESNAYKHKGAGPFAGPDHTFPIGDIAHGRNALARAHFAKNPSAIKAKVYAKYPELKKHHEERAKKK